MLCWMKKIGEQSRFATTDTSTVSGGWPAFGLSFADGKMVEFWGAFDEACLLRQLGLIEEPVP